MARGDDSKATTPSPPKRNPFEQKILNSDERNAAREQILSQSVSGSAELRLQALSWPTPGVSHYTDHKEMSHVGSSALSAWNTLSKIEVFFASQEDRWSVQKIEYLRGLYLACLNERLGYTPVPEAAHLRSEKDDLILARAVLKELAQSLAKTEGPTSGLVSSLLEHFRRHMELELSGLERRLKK